ncbi:putative metal dependent phosphohydrolase [Megalodesulfovibrio gigas DSM 1382 = ATCC 19364]|uniref:Putative metal dependent phosphohydrolase n=2 Tax=Megalodesulfovibrio gigas TaxID=879 RepID=T2GE95_MEGG1|nr:putative metal dependent phosphohydrolase [Megalodesulfovibrio gigas DSM 1382 = ATCC 19364]
MRDMLHSVAPHGGLAAFVLAMAAMSLLVGVRHTPGVKIFTEGEIATQDVMATQDMLVEDRNSTLERIHRIAENQPPIFDLTADAATRLATRVEAVFVVLNNATMDSMEDARWQAAELLNRELSRASFHLLRDVELQQVIRNDVQPWLAVRLNEGVVLDARMLERFRGGILVRNAALGAEMLRADLSSLRDVATLARELEQYLRRDLNKSLRVRSAISELLEPLITPSLVINPEATRDRIDTVMQSLEPVYYHIRKGEMVVRQGQRVGPQEQLKLQALYAQVPETFDPLRPLGVFVVSMLFAGGMIVSPKGRFFRPVTNRDALLMTGLVVLFAGGTKLLAAIETPLSERLDFLSSDLLVLMAPLAGAGGVMALYFSAASCVSASILLAFLCTQMAGAGLELFCFYFLGSISATLLIKHTETRTEVLRSVLPLTGLLLLAWFGIHLLKYQAAAGIWTALGLVVAHGFLALLCVLALGPIAEMLLGYTSRFRLLEQMSLEQPLLQELMVTSPGTYHHSLIVGNMVEAAARATGANPLLAKVAALYHDVGKIKNPHYFIENQMGCRNKHDKLAPSMSALILVSHVKKGVELARKHNISPEIIDILQQHHGTSLIRFFYVKAQEQAEARGGEPVSEADYRYPGPKPQTKEAGLVLLADAIEASSRTLVDPTPGRIKAHVDQIIRAIFTDGQLDDSELTLKDLTQASACFVRILNGIFHTRIEYPEARKEGTKACQTAGQPPSQAANPPGGHPAGRTAPRADAEREAILPEPFNGPLQ